MKIALVSPMLLPVPSIRGGAVEMLTTYLIEENEKQKKLDIDLYTIYDKKLEEFSYKKTNIIKIKTNIVKKIIQKAINFTYRITNKKKSFNIAWKEVARKIRKENYDLIVIENNMFLYKLISKKTNRNLIYHMHNDFNNFDKTKQNYKLIANTAKEVITVSEYIKNKVKSVDDFNRIKVLPNAIDDKLFTKTNFKNLREKYSIDKNDIVIGYAGRITEEKGILELVQAFKKLSNINKKIKLLIVGSQWYGNLEKDEYISKINSEMQEIKDKVVFTGYIDLKDMPLVYNTMDIVVIPSLCNEAFGCVAIEAMAMGKPIIASNVGGLPEIVKDQFGFTIQIDGDFVENLYSKIKYLVENDSLRNEYGKKANEEFEKNRNYHKTEYYNNFLEIIELNK